MAPDLNPPPTAIPFLADAGWGDGEIRPIAGDASFRRYFRIVAPGRQAMLMDAPPPDEDPRPFLAVAKWLSAHGFAAPDILAEDLEHGLVLLQDFGDARMRETADAAPESELRLYEAAIDLLVRLHREEPMTLRPYDMREYQREAGLLTEWYCPAIGIDADADGYRAAWDKVLPLAAAARPVTVLRDYHSENLMLIEGGETLGLLDFQDALAGHPAYDLVSLLQDARRDVPPALEAAMLDRYCRTTGASEDFVTAYHVLGAQRNAKIVGIFTRLWKRDGKPRYPGLCPRVWRYLNHDLEHPALAPVKAWFDANIPALRGDPVTVGLKAMVHTLSLRPNPKVSVPKTAMVMAAGLGKRMRPLTATRPKPLVEVAGKPLIDHVFDRLRSAGVERAVVNVHYLADALEAHLTHRVKGIEIAVSDERAHLLETGGGLAHARHLLGDDPILCVNSDNLWIDGPVDAILALAEQWDAGRMDALLLMVPLAFANNHRGQGDFHWTQMAASRRAAGRLAPFVYTGVQMLNPAIIADYPQGAFSTNLFWNRAIEAGRAWGMVHEGLWFDVGTPGAIAATEAILADG